MNYATSDVTSVSCYRWVGRGGGTYLGNESDIIYGRENGKLSTENSTTFIFVLKLFEIYTRIVKFSFWQTSEEIFMA